MLKPYDGYKETTIPWLREVPSHWSENRAKNLYKKENREPLQNDEVVTCFRDGQVTLRKNRRTTGFTESIKEHGYQHVKKGDLVIHVMDAFAGAVGVSDSSGKGTPVYSVCTSKVDINNYFYAYIIREMAKTGFIQSLYRGIRERSSDFRFEVFAMQLLPVPTREEQDQIVKYLDWQTSKINTFIKAKKKQIELLKEQKQAVINRAVTKGLYDTVPMKNSGIEWLGEVPEHWEIVKLTRLLTERNQKNRPELQLLSVVREKGVIIRDVGNKEENHNFIPDDLSGYKVVKTHQFVMNKMKAWQGSYGISRYIGIVSPAYYIFDVNFQNFNFFHWAIRSKVYVNFFAQASDGIRVGQWDLSKDKMKTIPFFIPPNNEQQAIVTYLEEKTAFIDKAIAVIEKEIELVSEYKTSLISSVVTGKVNVSNVVVPDFEVVEDEISEDEGLEVNMDDSN